PFQQLHVPKLLPCCGSVGRGILRLCGVVCAGGGAGALEETAAKGLAAAHGRSEGRLCPFASRWFICVWVLLGVCRRVTNASTAVAPASGGGNSCCVPGALFFLLVPCVCVRELLLFLLLTAAGMMAPLTVDAGSAYCFTLLLAVFFFTSHPLTQ
ncbi:trans-sialidase, partial [Trypanosoma cruzi]